jgi:hypothetical protein
MLSAVILGYAVSTLLSFFLFKIFKNKLKKIAREFLIEVMEDKGLEKKIDNLEKKINQMLEEKNKIWWK